MDSSSSLSNAYFEVNVSKEAFKFNAAHFVAFENYRERLHGHNYQVGVRLFGQRQIGADGYLIDFGIVKAVTKRICKNLNEHFLCPMHSNVMTIAKDDETKSISLHCHVDDSKFVFPLQDCSLLPIVHATAEELAIYLYTEILNQINIDDYLVRRGIHTMEIKVAEAPGQEAVFRHAIPKRDDGVINMNTQQFIAEGDVIPMPCLESDKNSSKKNNNCNCPDHCSCKTVHFTEQLEKLAEAINEGNLKTTDGSLTAENLRSFLSSK